MFRHDSLEAYFVFNFGPIETTAKFRTDVKINTNDTYFAIFGPNQIELKPAVFAAIKNRNGRVLYESPQAINRNYDWDDPRNTLIVFEFDEPVQV